MAFDSKRITMFDFSIFRVHSTANTLKIKFFNAIPLPLVLLCGLDVFSSLEVDDWRQLFRNYMVQMIVSVRVFSLSLCFSLFLSLYCCLVFIIDRLIRFSSLSLSLRSPLIPLFACCSIFAKIDHFKWNWFELKMININIVFCFRSNWLSLSHSLSFFRIYLFKVHWSNDQLKC